jgi:hypothetical protein
MKGFNGVIFTDEIGRSPAAVHLRSGILHINPDIFFQFPREWQKFIVLHELGHWKLQTRCEEKADAFAFHHFVQSGESLKDAVASLIKVLDTTEPAHRKRIEAALKKAQFWDSEIYQKQLTPKERLKAMNEYIKKENDGLAYCLGKGDIDTAKGHMVNILMVVDPAVQDRLAEKFANLIADVQLQNFDGNYLDDMTYFFCFGNKACQDRQKLKAAAKAELIKSKGLAKQSRAEAKVIRAQATQTRADAKKSLADQGLQDTTVKDVLKNVTDLGGKVAGAFIPGMGAAGTEQQKVLQVGMPDPTATGEEEKPKSKTGLFIGIAVALIIIAAIIAFFMLRKKS